MKKKYKIPDGWGTLKEVEFWWDGQPNKDIQKVVNRVRRMNFSEVEDMLVDFIYGQLRGVILVSKEGEQEK